jgi:hypothetical protein
MAPSLIAVAMVATLAAPAQGQLGRLKKMVTGTEEGKLYGFDVTEIPEIVFVVDFSIPVEFTDDQKSQLREYVAQEAGQLAYRKALEEGGDYAALMAGPAGGIVKAAISARRDKIGQARRHVKAAIDGLSEEQEFGVVTFEDEPETWDFDEATDDHKNEAKDVVDKAQGGDEDGGIVGFGMSLVKESLAGAMGLALQQELMAAAGGAEAGVPPAGAPQPAPGMPVGAPVPEPPPSARFAPSVEALLEGLEDAIEMGPDAVVLVVGAPPVGVAQDEFLAEVAEQNSDQVPIHVAEFGSEEGSPLYRALAEQSGGTYRTPE